MTDLINGGKKLCGNCGQEINAASFMMHEVFCAKNIMKCELCNEPFDKHLQDEHEEECERVKVTCELCGDSSIERRHVSEHRKSSCKKRQAKCLYCELELDADAMQEHVEFCGSRTEKCELCNRYIQARDQVKHETSGCVFPQVVVEKKVKKSSVPVQQAPPGSSAPAAKQPVSNSKFYSSTGISNSSSSRSKNASASSSAMAMRKSSSIKRNNPTTPMKQEKEKEETQGAAKRKNREPSFVLLPCEFCADYFNMDELLGHQNTCELNPQNSAMASSSTSSGTRQPQYGALAAAGLLGLDFGSLEDDDNDDYEDNSNARGPSNKKNDESESLDFSKIPCEFCTELIPFDDLIMHQSLCSHMLGSSSSSLPPSAAPLASTSSNLVTQNRQITNQSSSSRLLLPNIAPPPQITSTATKTNSTYSNNNNKNSNHSSLSTFSSHSSSTSSSKQKQKQPSSTSTSTSSYSYSSSSSSSGKLPPKTTVTAKASLKGSGQALPSLIDQLELNSTTTTSNNNNATFSTNSNIFQRNSRINYPNNQTNNLRSAVLSGGSASSSFNTTTVPKVSSLNSLTKLPPTSTKAIKAVNASNASASNASVSSIKKENNSISVSGVRAPSASSRRSLLN